MAASNLALDDPGRRKGSRIWWSVWPRRTGIGAIAGKKARWPMRRVEIAGIAAHANGLWMAPVARNLSDDVEGFLMGKRYLIHDRDPLHTAEFLGTLGSAGVKSVKLPPRSPNLNARAAFGPECRSRSLRNRCSPSPESSLNVC
jgi:hypothetical protein